MEKGFGGALRLPTSFPLYRSSRMKLSVDLKGAETKPAAVSRPDVIAIRKTCDAEGTGLSHYVLMDKQVKR
ncbi:hypothetical protein GALL_79950 [mine drainage metagenome]|uniref:Uncharacterized protein n=1 Tax=mine drainage metagenome TaxID=410659 RepID=A0A1J5SQ17_9ZZZZ